MMGINIDLLQWSKLNLHFLIKKTSGSGIRNISYKKLVEELQKPMLLETLIKKKYIHLLFIILGVQI